MVGEYDGTGAMQPVCLVRSLSLRADLPLRLSIEYFGAGDDVANVIEHTVESNLVPINGHNTFHSPSTVADKICAAIRRHEAFRRGRLVRSQTRLAELLVDQKRASTFRPRIFVQLSGLPREDSPSHCGLHPNR
jgi:hypothetical protein